VAGVPAGGVADRARVFRIRFSGNGAESFDSRRNFAFGGAAGGLRSRASDSRWRAEGAGRACGTRSGSSNMGLEDRLDKRDRQPFGRAAGRR